MASSADAVLFVNAMVGLPWERGACGPDAFDCWGIAQHAQRALFGRELPVVKTATPDLRATALAAAGSLLKSDWTDVPSPQHGDLVTMRADELHIGVFLAIDRGGVLHSIEGNGVRFDRLEMLPALGFHRPRFYRYCGGAQ